jgi:hypothetical protein
MVDAKNNPYGINAQYEVGDVVRIWKILKHPKGVIKSVVDPMAFPIKYWIRYTYFDGSEWEECFDATDITMVERRYDSWKCNCQTGSEHHERWCNRFSIVKP